MAIHGILFDRQHKNAMIYEPSGKFYKYIFTNKHSPKVSSKIIIDLFVQESNAKRLHLLVIIRRYLEVEKVRYEKIEL